MTLTVQLMRRTTPHPVNIVRIDYIREHIALVLDGIIKEYEAGLDAGGHCPEEMRQYVARKFAAAADLGALADGSIAYAAQEALDAYERRFGSSVPVGERTRENVNLVGPIDEEMLALRKVLRDSAPKAAPSARRRKRPELTRPTAALLAPIETREQAEAFLRELVRLRLDYHFDDGAIDCLCDNGVVSRQTATVIDAQVDRCYAAWEASGADLMNDCPIGFVLRLTNPEGA